MSRTLKISLWSAFGLVAVIALFLFAFVNYDWNRQKPWINAKVSEATGRPFAIKGDVAILWRRPVTETIGWQAWIPWPQFSARDIEMGNPDWVKAQPDMVKVGQASFTLNPLALLDKRIVISGLTLDNPSVYLERAADNKNNWTLKPAGDSKWKFEVAEIGLNKGQIRIVDAIKKADLRIAADTIGAASTAGYELGLKLSGTLGKESVSGTGKAGDILSLQQIKTVFPVEADVRIGKTALSFKGTLTNPRSLAALDARLKLSGVSMAKLYSLTGIPFPETPPFATEGHLTGKFGKQGSDWIYDKFSGKVGSSDLSGTFEYASRQPRPYLKGVLVSNLLNFKDLAPLIGADSKASKVAREADVAQPGAKMFPIEPFKTERWTSIDADVKFSGRKIIRDKQLPIDNLVTDLTLKDGVVSLQPLTFGIAGGQLISTIVLDGRSNPIKAQIKTSARNLKIKQLFPEFKLMQASLGAINGDASLSSTGNSVSAMLASSNGEVKAFIDGGTISKLLLEQIGLNIGNVILTKLQGDTQVKLNCMASDFSVTQGVMTARTFLVDTEDALLNVTGQIDLAQEKLALTIKPDTRSLRVLTLRAPLYVTGSFKAPKVEVDKGVLALKTGAAVALGVLAPVLTAVIPLVNLGPDRQNSECARLLKDVKTRPVAPPPGKKLKS